MILLDTTEESKPTTYLTTGDLVLASGLTERQVYWAIETGKIKPIDGRKGSGVPLQFPLRLVSELTLVRKRLQWGFSVAAAWRQTDPAYMPPPPNFQNLEG